MKSPEAAYLLEPLIKLMTSASIILMQKLSAFLHYKGGMYYADESFCYNVVWPFPGVDLQEDKVSEPVWNDHRRYHYWSIWT